MSASSTQVDRIEQDSDFEHQRRELRRPTQPTRAKTPRNFRTKMFATSMLPPQSQPNSFHTTMSLLSNLLITLGLLSLFHAYVPSPPLLPPLTKTQSLLRPRILHPHHHSPHPPPGHNPRNPPLRPHNLSRLHPRLLPLTTDKLERMGGENRTGRREWESVCGIGGTSGVRGY
jgi:hypothetical protein